MWYFVRFHDLVFITEYPVRCSNHCLLVFTKFSVTVALLYDVSYADVESDIVPHNEWNHLKRIRLPLKPIQPEPGVNITNT